MSVSTTAIYHVTAIISMFVCVFIFADTVSWRQCWLTAHYTKECIISCRNGTIISTKAFTFRQIWLVSECSHIASTNLLNIRFCFVSFTVYLRTTPEVVYDRMKVRGRSEENSVSLDYLKQLHDLYEGWLVKGQKSRPAPVLILNADLDVENITEEYIRSEASILRSKSNEEKNLRIKTNWAKT